jgi:hypothetical protein
MTQLSLGAVLYFDHELAADRAAKPVAGSARS